VASLLAVPPGGKAALLASSPMRAALLSALTDADARVRATATTAYLAVAAYPAGLAALVRALLPSPDTARRVFGASAVDELVRVLENDDPAAVSSALHLLDYLCDPATPPSPRTVAAPAPAAGAAAALAALRDALHGEENVRLLAGGAFPAIVHGTPAAVFAAGVCVRDRDLLTARALLARLEALLG